jgi:hypothetical protein
MIAQAIHRRPMIESFRTHPFTRTVCLEAARLFEQRAAKDLVEAQRRADDGALGEGQRLQAKARHAQQRARAWHLRAQNAADGLMADEGQNCSQQMTRTRPKKVAEEQVPISGDKGKQATANQLRASERRERAS